MSDPFIGEIRVFPYTYAPLGWASCDGQIMQAVQNQALYAVIGNTYGGSAPNTFGLPNLQGRAPMDFGSGPGLTPRSIGESLGAATVSLNSNNFPPHTHNLSVVGNSDANTASAANNYLGRGKAPGSRPRNVNTYNTPSATPAQLAVDAVQVSGTATGAVSHDNMQPYLSVMLCIALEGIFPVRP